MSVCSSGEEEGGGGSGRGPWGVRDVFDQAYASAIQRAAASAAEADSMGSSGSAGGPMDGFIGPLPPPGAKPATAPSLWAALPGGARLLQRFVAHRNEQTDIKEAVFLGPDDALVACGSDDGRVFIYDAATGQCLRALQADEDVANCVRPHPWLPVLATSGIESTVKVCRGCGELTQCFLPEGQGRRPNASSAPGPSKPA